MGRSRRSIRFLQGKRATSDYMRGQPPKENAVAFCHNKSHRGLLSKKMMKKHECLKKQCPYLSRLDTEYATRYWKERENRRNKRKVNIIPG